MPIYVHIYICCKKYIHAMNCITWFLMHGESIFIKTYMLVRRGEDRKPLSRLGFGE